MKKTLKIITLAFLLPLPSCATWTETTWPIQLALKGYVTPPHECYEAGCVEWRNKY